MLKTLIIFNFVRYSSQNVFKIEETKWIFNEKSLQHKDSVNEKYLGTEFHQDVDQTCFVQEVVNYGKVDCSRNS